MAEWFKAAVLKTVDPKGPGVRIPLPPPARIDRAACALTSFLYDCGAGVNSAAYDIGCLITERLCNSSNVH
jgi:hypothetical protein